MKRNKFSLSHYKLLTLSMGQLIPLAWYDVLPGDSIRQSTSALVRATPLLAPVMHPVKVRIHHFFIPWRILWEDFEEFITGGPDGNSTPIFPKVNIDNVAQGSLSDYFGVKPQAATTDLLGSALPYRAYNMIFNEHYRDQDLTTPLEISQLSGLDTTTAQDIQRCSWEKDYFTTCRPWEQKGTAISIPIGDSSAVVTNGLNPNFNSGALSNLPLESSTSAGLSLDGETSAIEFPTFGSQTGLSADLTTATGVSINDLRLALSIQKYQEARAMYGSRYVEYLRHLGVRSSDARLQNPEYLGGGRQTIQFSEVVSPVTTTDSQAGEMAGHGIAAMRTNKFQRYFEEHGMCMSLMSVVPKSIYNSTLHRSFSREVKEDVFQKELQHIGEQEVYNKEIQSDHSNPEGIFGYQARYDEYRSHPSSVSGEFRTIQDHWHYARKFESDVALNETFTKATPTKRVNASQDTDVLYVMANHSIQARRPIAGQGRPSL